MLGVGSCASLQADALGDMKSASSNRKCRLVLWHGLLNIGPLPDSPDYSGSAFTRADDDTVSLPMNVCLR